MNSPEIFKLTIYCWHEIFKQIKLNCETTESLRDRYNLVKYLDLINLAISFETITNAFKQWSPQLYEELDIENTFLSRSPHITIDFSKRYEAVQSVSNKDKDIFWKSFFGAIEDNEKLQSIELNYEPSQFYPEHFDRFAALVNAIKNKRTLRTLAVKMQGYTFQDVPRLGNLSGLLLYVRMDVDDLTELCRSNPKLSSLTYHSPELYGRLTDIVPYCNSLVTLNLTLKPEVDATEYVHLAKLPRLRKLKLNGYHQEGTLVELFKALKLKRLQKILVPDTILSREESQALAEINSLTLIKVGFSDIPSIGSLANLTKLQYLSVKTRDQPDQFGLIEPIMRFIPKICVELVSDSFRFLTQFSEDEGLLRLNFDPSKDVRESDDFLSHHVVTLSQRLNNIRQLILIGDFGSTLRQALFQRLACQEPQILEKLLLGRKNPMSVEEATALSAIRSLTTIFCKYTNLERINAMKIQQLNGVTEKSGRVDRIKAELVEIYLIHDSNSVALTLDFLDSEVDIATLAPLTNVPNLKKVEVKGTLIDISIDAFFKSLASIDTQSLQELQITIVEPEELRALSQIKTLKLLNCGLFCSQNVEHLADMKQLESLTLTVHPKGSLKTLFNRLASREDQVLRTLSIQGVVLTPEEIFEVSGIKSLEKLSLGRRFAKSNPWVTEKWMKQRSCQRCLDPLDRPIDKPHNIEVSRTFSQNSHEGELVACEYRDPYASSSASNLELLARLPNLKELCLYTSFKVDCMGNLLKDLADHQKLCKLSLTLCPERIEDEQKFDLTISQIALLPNLTELYLENPEGYVLADLLDLIQTSSRLRSLELDRTFIDYEESLKVGRMKNLEKLMVGFSNKDSFQVLTKLTQLKDLEISSPHVKIERKIMPILRSCKNLKSIFLRQNLSHEFINSILEVLKTVRDPSIQGPLILRAQLSDCNFPVQLDKIDEAYLIVEQQAIDEGILETDDFEFKAMKTPLWSRWW